MRPPDGCRAAECRAAPMPLVTVAAMWPAGEQTLRRVRVDGERHGLATSDRAPVPRTDGSRRPIQDAASLPVLGKIQESLARGSYCGAGTRPLRRPTV